MSLTESKNAQENRKPVHHDPAIGYDRFRKTIEEFVRKWGHSHAKHSTNSVAEELEYCSYKLILRRYWLREISSKKTKRKAIITKTQKKGNKNLSTQEELPEAFLEVMGRPNLCFESDSHKLYQMYGLKEFIVLEMERKSDLYNELKQLLLNIFAFVALKKKCQLPIFVDHEYCDKPYGSDYGVLACHGFELSFENWIGIESSETPKLEYAKEKFNWIDKKPFSEMQISAKVSATYTHFFSINGWDSERKFYDDFYSDDYWYDKYKLPNISLYFNTTWLDMPYNEVISREAESFLDPLEAHIWSIKAKIHKELYRRKPTLEYLESLLSLCSTQTESLLSNHQISSIVEYRRKYKQGKEVNLEVQGLTKPEVRKVTSKLVLKSEDSFISVESLNEILDFIFCDARLQPSKNSNGGDPSTTSADDVQIEDAFYFSYRGVSKYFKLAQLTSLTSRLALCICIVNKYHGGLKAVNQLWGEFVLEMKYCLENNCEIKGLTPVEPTLDYPELLQKLEIMNTFIKNKKDIDASSTITDTSTNVEDTTEISSGTCVDISAMPLGGPLKVDRPRSTVSTSTIGLLHVVRNMFNRMSAVDVFEAANPECAIGDFVRWCSSNYRMEETISDEGWDKYTNEGHTDHRIKISDEITLLFHKSAPTQKRFPDDDASKVLHWLASVKPSELVLKLMPILIYSAVSHLLNHPLRGVGFQKDILHLRNALIEAAQSTYTIEMLEDQIHSLTLIVEQMEAPHYLWMKFKQIDPLNTLSDSDLVDFISRLVASEEVTIDATGCDIPSRTSLGKLLYRFATDHKEINEQTKRERSSRRWHYEDENEEAEKKKYEESLKEWEANDAQLLPTWTEYVLTFNNFETTGIFGRFHFKDLEKHTFCSAVFTPLDNQFRR